MQTTDRSLQIAVCVENGAYAAALERRKMYQIVHDPAADRHGMLRVIDESGEDYLYPRECFILLDLPLGLKEQLFQVA